MPEPGKIYRGRTSRRRAKTGPDANDVARTAGMLVVECSRPSLLENPFRIEEGGTREQAVRDFRAYLKLVFNSRGIRGQSRGDKVKAHLEELRREHLAGREIVLLCYCVDGPCHTDVIKEWIEKGVLE